MSGLTVHFDLLKKEHQILVSKYNDLLRNSAQNPNCLAVQLFSFVTELYKKELLSDITIVVGAQTYPSHKFLLGARTDYWTDLASVNSIEISDVSVDIFDVIFHWLYTDILSPDIRDSELLKVAEQACKYKFTGLLNTCELWLRSRLDINNCVEIFEFAENSKLVALSEQCSTLVAARWKEFRPENFTNLSANLLYRLLKGNSDNVLRSIIQLGREDVLFLFFIDNESKLTVLLNEQTTEMCALEEALSLQMPRIADQLVQHGADVNLVYSSGDSILMRLIEKGDIEGLCFLCRNNVKLNGIQDMRLNITPLQQLCSCPLSPDLLNWLKECITKMEVNVVPGAKDPDISRSPLSLACLNEDEHTLQLVQILLTNSAKPNLLDSDSLFPLYHALFINKRLDLAEELVKNGADINVTVNGEPLFHLLVAEPASFKFLLKQKPNLTLVNSQESPILHHAIHSFEANHRTALELVTALTEAGAEVSSCDAEQRTALHLAVETDRRIVEALRPFLGQFPWERQNKLGKTVLQLALEKKELETAQLLINYGAPVNENNGQSLLIETLGQGDDDGAVFLLLNKADYHVKDSYNRSPLELALSNGLIGTVRSLCGSGVNLNERSQNGYCVVERALVNDHLDCVSLLIGYGCDLQSWTECEDGQQTLLHHLMDQGNEKAAIFLIENGVEINTKKKFKSEADDDGQTPLHMAVAWGLTEVVRALINHGADLLSQDKDERTACHIAVRENNTEALKLLLAAPDVSFISTRDKKGQTPLSLAIGRKDQKSAEAIVSRQPHAALQTNGNGENLLHAAVKANDLESVLFLLGTHTDPTRTTQDQLRRTALHLSASIENELIMRNLILAGCVVDARSSDGSTSLHEAIRARKPNLVSILLENQARTDILDEKGECAILCAVRSGSLECVKVLFEHNCLAGPVINRQEQSVLHVCASLSSDKVEKGATAAEICEVLLKHEEWYMTEKELGMFVDARDKNGNTALLIGFMQGNAGVCRTLLKRGATMAAKNNDGVTLFTYETPTKQLLFGLLDSLEKEPRWSDGDYCDCGVKFSITQRKHHCRHCGRVVCGSCSSISMPIVKFGEEKKVRVCSMCSIVLTEGGGRF